MKNNWAHSIERWPYHRWCVNMEFYILNSERQEKLDGWLATNCNGNYQIIAGRVIFDNEEDATMFYLAFKS